MEGFRLVYQVISTVLVECAAAVGALFDDAVPRREVRDLTRRRDAVIARRQVPLQNMG